MNTANGGLLQRVVAGQDFGEVEVPGKVRARKTTDQCDLF
jgi:hypothetical protein